MKGGFNSTADMMTSDKGSFEANTASDVSTAVESSLVTDSSIIGSRPVSTAVGYGSVTASSIFGSRPVSTEAPQVVDDSR